MVLAVRRRYPYDLPFVRGRADAIPRDLLTVGTALSAPAWMLAMQASAVVQLARGRRDHHAATAVLGALGSMMVVGYLAEAHVRRRLRPSGWERLESPLVLTGLGSAAAMAVLARSY
jgi:hypothetical protein